MGIEPAKKYTEFFKVDISDQDLSLLEDLQTELVHGDHKSKILGGLLFGSAMLIACRDNLSTALVSFIVIGTMAIILTRSMQFWHKLGVKSKLGTIHAHATLVGAIWGIIIGLPLALSLANPGLTALVGSGLIFFGSISFSSVPRAFRNYLVLCCLGVAAGFIVGNGPDALVLAAGTIFYGLLSFVTCQFLYSNFATRVIRERDLVQSADTVKLLLNDYETQSSDWLWECDLGGKIINPSQRFAEACELTLEELRQTPAANIFDTALSRKIIEVSRQHEPFHNLEVPLTINGQERWWKVSGRPIVDGNGVLTGMRGVTSDVTEARKSAARISYLASYDSLTNLPNRAMFGDTLTRALSRRKSDISVAVLYLDLDHFKAVNDSLGHGIGDEVLKTAAERIESCLDLNDIVGRFGGDEFVVLLPNITKHCDAEKVAANIVNAMSKPIFVDKQQINCGVSIGIAFAPDHAESAEQLIKNADLALYQSKQSGRSCFTHFEVEMHESMQERRQIEVDLRAAISRDELQLYYQPLINVENNKVSGYEALVRWHHPEKGLIMPTTFIPIAEETGLIVALGDWVIRNALDEATRWPEHLGVSVNLSPDQLASPGLLPTIIHALASSGVAPDRLELEITETVLMRDTEANVSVLHKLKGLGIHIALDDFGTGYSSLNYLLSFPFDKIKIDRCFVENVAKGDESKAIIRAVTDLASKLGMVTTAEGVENADQLNQLRREGCTEVQGYHFSRPVPAELLAERNAKHIEKTAETVEIEKPDARKSPSISLQAIRKSAHSR